MVVRIHPEGPNNLTRTKVKKLEVAKEVETAIRWAFVDSVMPEEYKTIGGNLAIVVTKHGGGENPWLGFYYTTNQVGGEWIPCAWTERGKILSISKSAKPVYPLDLDILEDQPQFV